MSALSNYSELKLLDHILGTATFTKPTAVYLALFTTDPTDAATGTEVSGNGYARQACAFAAAASGTTSNSAQEAFTAAGGNWGAISHWALFDALTVGNMLIHGSFTTTRTVNDGDTLTVAAGDIDITAD